MTKKYKIQLKRQWSDVYNEEVFNFFVNDTCVKVFTSKEENKAKKFFLQYDPHKDKTILEKEV